MDDVIAATGMPSSAIYRFFRSKDDLIDAVADEALALIRDLFDRGSSSSRCPRTRCSGMTPRPSSIGWGAGRWGLR
jgi:AcrR family transcriptional regulator